MKVTHREGGFRICLYTAVCGICCRHTSDGVSDDLADISTRHCRQRFVKSQHQTRQLLERAAAMQLPKRLINRLSAATAAAGSDAWLRQN